MLRMLELKVKNFKLFKGFEKISLRLRLKEWNFVKEN